MKQILHFGGTKQLIGSTTPAYYGLNSGAQAFASVYSASSPWPIGATASNLKIVLDDAPGTGKSVTYTLVVNGTPSALTVTIGNAGLSASDTTHTVSITAGDDVCLQRVLTSSPTTSDFKAHLEFDTGSANVSGYSYPTHPSFTEGVELFPGYNASGQEALAALNSMPIAGSVTGYQVVNYNTSGAARANLPSGKTIVFNIYKNGVKQDGTGGTVNTTTTLTDSINTVSWSGTLPVVVGDEVYLGMVVSSGLVIFFLGVGTSFTATTAGDFILGGGTAPTSTLPSYTSLTPSGDGFSNTEADAAGIGGPTTYYIKSLTFKPSTVSGSPSAYSAVGRVNSATPTRTLTASVTGTLNPDGAWGVWAAASAIAPSSAAYLTITDSDRWDFLWTSALVGSFAFGYAARVVGVTRSVLFNCTASPVALGDPGTWQVSAENIILDGPVTAPGLTFDLLAAWDALGT